MILDEPPRRRNAAARTGEHDRSLRRRNTTKQTEGRRATRRLIPSDGGGDATNEKSNGWPPPGDPNPPRGDGSGTGTRFLLIVLDDLPFVPNCKSELENSLKGLENPGLLIAATAIISTTSSGRWAWEDKPIYVCHHKKNSVAFWHRAFALFHCPDKENVWKVTQVCLNDEFALQMFLYLLYINPYRSSTEIERLYNALDEHRNNTSKIMLMFCYNDMPIKYKTCLQYLSIFPQGHIIRRTNLIRRWLAEGLVTDRRSSSTNMGIMKSGDHNTGINKLAQLDDHAERVFDALVARGFISPGETSAAGKIKTCTIHHIVHDFIATDVSFMDTCLPPDIAHRSDQWQLIKVLDLEGCRGLTKKHLKNICNILLLKYLSLRDTDVIQLPKQINKLRCLETLDIRQTKIMSFAPNSILLPMLKHLLAGSKVPSSNFNNSHCSGELLATVRLPSGIGRMKRLEVLSYVDTSNNVDELIHIGQLLQMKKLGVILDGKKIGGLVLLLQQIEKLNGCLRALSIQINQPAASEGTMPETEQLPALKSPPKLLQSLKISGITSWLPKWIAELDQLTKITLSETCLGEDDIQVLGKLRTLRCLRLWRESYTGTKLTFIAKEFQNLRSLIIEGCNITEINFVNIGATPKLEMIIWSFASIQTLSLSGTDHLPRLKKVELNGNSDIVAVRQSIKAHPNSPVFIHNSSHQHQETVNQVADSAP
uniref:NB-ARC domain-containing protein n=1 Tax=Leersia perrieri TaxID=77586 RepID=A0A0D9XUV1_9ORYZ